MQTSTASIDSVETRKRADLVPLAKPQCGVDVLHGKFRARPARSPA